MRALRIALIAAWVVLGSPVAGAGSTTFVDAAPAAGVDAASYGRGAAMVDLDGDGLLDLIAANDAMMTQFYRQLPDHTFVLANDEWGVPTAEDDDNTWGVLAADFDNDGDDDVYLMCLGYPTHRNRFLRNDINTTGGFTDISNVSGDARMVPRNFSGTTLDYNNDGLLDIFLTGPAPSIHNFLLRNDGNLVFTDVSEEAGFTQEDQFRHCSAGDYNNDGCIDIAVGNYGGANYLYKNNCDGTFVNVAAEAGVQSATDQNFGLVFDDFDNDGWMDIWVPKYLWQGAPPGETGELYRNNGDGTFTDVTAGANMTGQSDMGHSSADVNGDGYPDLYIGTGHPGYRDDDVLLLVTPDGNGGFATEDVSESSGITSSGTTRCHGMAFGDYDQDGKIDIWVNNGGPPSDDGDEVGDEIQIQENFLWNGAANTYNWLAVDLEGTVSNRTAVGARAVVMTGEGRSIHRMLRVGHGFANTDSHTLHFGLGNETVVKRVIITWPSGIVQTVFDPAINQTIQVTEAFDDLDAGRLPDGDAVPGDLMRIDRVGDDLFLSWGMSCSSTDTDYEVYEGVLGHFESHEPRRCSTNGLPSTTLLPSPGDTYYLVVPRNTSWEGSYGLDSQGNERPPSLVNPCLDQRVAGAGGC